MTHEDVIVLVSSTFHSYNEILAYPTSKVTMANCGHLVWIAQAGRRELRRDPGIYVICEECQQQSYLPPDEKIRSAEGAMEEIEQIAGPVARRRAEAWFRSTGGRSERQIPWPGQPSQGSSFWR